LGCKTQFTMNRCELVAAIRARDLSLRSSRYD
jgi:hypothetical protein